MYGSILLFHISFLTTYSSCDNSQTADTEQDNPDIHHAVVAGLRAVGIGGKTYVVFTYIALAVGVSICVSCCVGLVAASTFVPMVVLVRLPSFTPVTSPVLTDNVSSMVTPVTATGLATTENSAVRFAFICFYCKGTS